MKRTVVAVFAAASVFLSGCDDITSNNDTALVTLGFSTTVADAGSSLTSSVSPALVAANGEIVLNGDNGTLVINYVGFIVDEFKLERDNAPCEEVAGEDDDCETFETGLAFVELPLGGTTVPVVTQSVPAGTYVALKLETDDADLDEAEGEDDAEITALVAAIEGAGFTDWPENASLVVSGSFTPTDGELRNFTAYFEAEIRIEMDFETALVIEGEPGTLDIIIDLAAWYTNADETVMDLSAFDYATTGQVVDFEAKMIHGFSKIELEGFDD